MKTRLIILGMFVALLLTVGQAAAGDNTPLVFDIRWSPDGKWISASSTMGAWFFDTENPEAEPLHWFPESNIPTIAFDPSGKRAALFNDTEQKLVVIRVETGDVIYEVVPEPSTEDYSSVVYDIQFSSDGRLLVVSNTSMLYLYDAVTGAFRKAFYYPSDFSYGYSSWITTITQADNAETFFTADWAGAITAFTLEETQPLDRFSLGETGIYSLEWLSNRATLLMHNYDGLYYVDPSSQESALVNEAFAEGVYGFDTSNSEALLAVGLPDRWLIYNMEDESIPVEYPVDEKKGVRMFAFAFSPDDAQLVTMDTEGRITVWDVATGEALYILGEFTRAVSYQWG